MRDIVILIKHELKENKSDNADKLYSELGKLLEKEGLSTIEFTGKFNNEKQRIIGTEQTDIDENDNMVFRTIRPGYIFNEKIIRPQEVIVFVKS